MNEEVIPIFADAIDTYYKPDDIHKLCKLFDISFEQDMYNPNYFDLARKLILETEKGNNHRLLSALYDSLTHRCQKAMIETKWEARELNEEMSSKLDKLRPIVEAEGLPAEIVAPESKPFFAKSKVRELLQNAETEILIVDPYIGTGTLDCFRDTQQNIRLLTGSRSNQIEQGFDDNLKEFISEGRKIEVKQHDKLHDRYIIFNERCWLVGSSLKDAGKKAFNVIEFLDSRESILRDIEKKWTEAKEFLTTTTS